MKSPSAPPKDKKPGLARRWRAARAGTAALAPLHRLLEERSPRERVLLALALVGALAAGAYLLLAQWTPRFEQRTVMPTSAWQELSAITPVDPDVWRRAAIDHGLALTSIYIAPAGDVVVTRARAESAETFTQFAQWAAQQGWWALDWTLEREATDRIIIDTRWHSQPEQTSPDRQQPPRQP